MNYATHYDRLIARARGRVLTGYRERHHVLPRCMGGTDAPGNVVDLTPEEHYVAHQLLVKMHPKIERLAYSAIMMSRRCSGNKSFGWLRRRLSEARLGVPLNLSPEARQKRAQAISAHCASMSAVRMGHVVTEETRRRISETKRAQRRGTPKPPRPRQWSPEHRAKLAAAKLGKSSPRTPEWQAKIAAALRGKKRAPFSAEWRENMSKGQRRRRSLCRAM